MSNDCVFCKIIRQEIPAEILTYFEHAIVVRDIRPRAAVHLVVISKKHVSSVNDIPLTVIDNTLDQLLWVARFAAHREKLDDTGYRMVINVGPDAGQTVQHLHIHVLGGEKLKDI